MPARLADVQELEQGPLLAVVRARRVAERRSRPAVALLDQLLAGELLVGRVPLAADLLVEVLRERLREAVGERLRHDRPVVVVLGLVGLGQLVGAEAGGDGEGADVILDVGLQRRDEVRDRLVRLSLAAIGLLPEAVEDPASVEDEVVAVGMGGEVPVDAARLEQVLRHDPIEHLLPDLEQLPSGLAHLRVFEDLRVAPLQLPGGEEEGPVDVVAEHREVGLDGPGPDERGRRSVLRPPVHLETVLERLAVGEERRLQLRLVERAEPVLVLPVVGVQLRLARLVEQGAHHADDARGVHDVDDGLRVRRRDLHRRVLLRGRGAADQQRVASARAAASPSPRSPSRSSEGVIRPERPITSRLLALGRIEDRLRGRHHAEVDDAVVVAAEDHAHDVLADVVDVALHRGGHDRALRASPTSPSRSFSSCMKGSR